MMNPGWEQPDDLHPFVANLTKDPSVGLADYIVKERIFNFFLYQGNKQLKRKQQINSDNRMFCHHGR